jgi:Tfp pilus assembly protein PilX
MMPALRGPNVVAPRKGMALVLAIGAIVIVGALIVSMFFASSLRGKNGSAARAHALAMATADFAVNEALHQITAFQPDSLAVGGTSPAINRPAPGGGRSSATVTRLQNNLYLLVAEGTAPSQGGAGLVRRAGFLFRMMPAVRDSAGNVTQPGVPVRAKERAWMQLFQ